MRQQPTTDSVWGAGRSRPVPSVGSVDGARRFAVWVEAGSDGVVVVKQGSGAVAAAALHREAEVLAAFRHPGVVAVVAVDSTPHDAAGHTRLTTRFAGSHTLRTAPPATAALLVLRAGQLLATLAGLHSRGLVHGAVDASHVVVGPGGAARWCGLGRVRAAPAAARAEETRAAADLAARTLSEVRFPHHRASSRGRAERRMVDEASAVLADGRLDAGGLASALTTLLPIAPTGNRRLRRRRSAKADGDLVGQQSAGDREDEMLAPPLHQAVQNPVDLLR